MDDTNRLISFFGVKPTRQVQRAVQKQIDRWIERKKNYLSLHKESGYEVRFEQDSVLKSCSCHVRIQIGTCTWEGTDVGRSLQEALFLALKHPLISFVHPRMQMQYISSVPEVRGVA